ncbi:ArsR family transcriptional regulator [Virgisporangium aliadipatigenens]|uniref:ArsR family transcriptional regulator n=1 Tax=Virgisporangium aliadipatigenens TaxID=741659 RepID=A0A8J4DPU8_9ACTN|nr:transcriptional regulator [Virgisporangium aliadipatigenens]GIJ45894.1 ArsR family transcriptional regulator [Virgisporangium aliadipatigenens]
MTASPLAVLHDPVRRGVYEFVAAQGAPVGRDAVAGGMSIGRTLAAFHLDKLAAAGLLEVTYARPAGRTGPGAGRPAKLYRRAVGEHLLSVPPREYRALAEILAEAVEESGADAAAAASARRQGAARTAAIRGGLAPDDGADPVALLTELGYEPYLDGADVRLRNCPFGTVAAAFPPLVCGLNLALIEGVLDGSGCAPRLDPRPEGCCVAIRLSKNNGD